MAILKSSQKPIIGIIGGTSQFGQWFKSFFEINGLKVLIASRKTDLTSVELAKTADIVIVSVPLRATLGVIKEIRKYLHPDALLADFTSLKEKSLKEMMKAGCGVLGIHPLFGPLSPSIKNQLIVFCLGRQNRWVDYLKNIFEKNGAKVIFTTSEEHDQQMAIIQALTHFTNIVLARTIQKEKLSILDAYATPVFRLQSILMGRILGSNPELYAELEMENPFFLKILREFFSESRRLGLLVKNKDYRKFIKIFSQTADSMKNFIPIAQLKSTEIISLIEHQPIEIKKQKRIFNLKAKKNIKLAFLGPEGTYSHRAALDVFPNKTDLIACPTIAKIFEIINSGEFDFGIVPAENSSEGIIEETLDNLIDYPLSVLGSYNLDIHHCLLGRTDNFGKIKTIKSHFQPLAQCKNWLSKNFPQAILETTSSSTQAILSTNDLGTAFIASREAAKKYGLKILAENIEDKKSNTTQFYVLSKSVYPEISRQLKAKKTLILIAVYDRPGVLRDILNSFASREINLSKLHSRPSAVGRWNYYFFLEVEALPENKNLKEALKGIKKYCAVLRILGVS
ncbi:MAG: prephenate dehydratase [bacterium]|nr:prephenate dehydratase [bacterium]